MKFDEVFGKRDFKKKYVGMNPCNFDMIFSNIVLEADDTSIDGVIKRADEEMYADKKLINLCNELLEKSEKIIDEF